MADRESAHGGGGGGASNCRKKVKICSDDHPLFFGTSAMVNFGAVGGSSNSFFQFFDPQENGDEHLDDYFNQPDKKKRLSVDQVQFLETSFKNENKLEPERKVQLADELGLQPRQIAVWFQNRRARWKTKQLETEYEALNSSYTTLKMDYDYLIKENEKLKAQVFHLKHDGLTEGAENMIMSRECYTREGVACNNDDQSSEKSDDTSARLSDAHDGEDSLNEELLQYGNNVFTKIEDAIVSRMQVYVATSTIMPSVSGRIDIQVVRLDDPYDSFPSSNLLNMVKMSTLDLVEIVSLCFCFVS